MVARKTPEEPASASRSVRRWRAFGLAGAAFLLVSAPRLARATPDDPPADPGAEPDAVPARPGSSPAAPEGPGEEPDAEKAIAPHPSAAMAKEGEAAAQEEPPNIVPKFATGFVMATTGVAAVPAAVPKNRLDYTLQGIAGIAAVGTPWEKWDYLAYIITTVQASAISGTAGSVAPEQITIRYSPTKEFSLQAGYMRMPFSLAQSAVIANAMFPTRPEPTIIFQGGADAGLMAGYETKEGELRVKAGLFDGLSLGLTLPQLITRGPVVVASIEVSPLGGMKAQEADFGESPFRIMVSGSFLYRSASAYDPTGYAGLDLQDTRFTGALRLGFKGIFVQGEYLQAVQTDDRSNRARITRGAYGEASYYAAIKKKVGISPLARIGWSEQDESFFPLHVVSLHGGLAFYPRGDVPDPGVLRFVLQYRSERRIEERETGYGGVLSAMLRF